MQCKQNVFEVLIAAYPEGIKELTNKTKERPGGDCTLHLLCKGIIQADTEKALANETAGQTQPPSLTQQQIQALAAALSSALPSLPSAPTLEDYVAFAVEILASQRQPPRRPRKENATIERRALRLSLSGALGPQEGNSAAIC